MNTMTLEQFADFVPPRPTYALFGDPVEHSVSPQLHQLLLESHGLPCDYVAVRVPAPELGRALQLARGKIRGCNLTIPHKVAAIPHLDALSPAAQALQSVNTIAIDEQGRLTGHNTDYDGFARSLQRDGIDPAGRHALLLGCGGVSNVMAHYLLESGAASLTVAARNPEKAAGKLRQWQRAFPAARLRLISLAEPAPACQIVCNATPVGMFPREEESPIAALPRDAIYCFDAIYNPPATALLRLAEQAGVPGRDGLYMLVMQAARAQEIWQGLTFTPEQIESVLQSLYADLALQRLRQVHGKENLVLCGFMGSGKTTVGRRLSQLSSWPLIDCDQRLEQEAGQSINAIFATQGEEAFRRMEHALLLRLSQEKGQILSTGGGSVLRPDNVRALQKTGFLVYLNPPLWRILENLQGDDSRPLLSGPDREETIASLRRARDPVYRAACQIEVTESDLSAILTQLLRHI